MIEVQVVSLGWSSYTGQSITAGRIMALAVWNLCKLKNTRTVTGHSIICASVKHLRLSPRVYHCASVTVGIDCRGARWLNAFLRGSQPHTARPPRLGLSSSSPGSSCRLWIPRSRPARRGRGLKQTTGRLELSTACDTIDTARPLFSILFSKTPDSRCAMASRDLNPSTTGRR